MSQFLKALLLNFGLEYLAERSEFLFTEAKQALHFKWGKKMKEYAVACAYIACRELNKSVTMIELAVSAYHSTARSRCLSHILGLTSGAFRDRPTRCMPCVHQNQTATLVGCSRQRSCGLSGPSYLPFGAVISSSISFGLHCFSRRQACDRYRQSQPGLHISPRSRRGPDARYLSYADDLIHLSHAQSTTRASLDRASRRRHGRHR